MTAPDSPSTAANSPFQGGVRALILSAGDRVRSLAEDIDGVIAGIQADAEAHRERLAASESTRDPHDARTKLLSDLAEGVGDYAAGLRRQCDELCEVLDRASRRL